MSLVKDAPDYTFIYRDLALDEHKYRIFDYHLASWTSFMLPNALNCRGTMFNITNSTNPVLVCLPPPKFFNYEEGTINHTKDKYLGDVMTKMDGSLISSYLHNGTVRLKSKGHLFSEQAVLAQKLLDKKYPELKLEILSLAKNDYTVNFEYTSPTNTIVVIYPNDRLTVLNIRSIKDGRIYFGSEIKEKFGAHYPHVIKNLVEFRSLGNENLIEGKLIDKFVDDVKKEVEGEGYVVEIRSKTEAKNYLVKIKNTHYISLHHAKASIESPSRLLETIIYQRSDDLKALASNDKNFISIIERMEEMVIPIYNKLMLDIDAFYEANKTLDRKAYAIKGTTDLGMLFMLAMNKYLGKDPQYADFAFKYRKKLFPIIDFSVEKEAAPDTHEEAAGKIKLNPNLSQ